MAESMKGLKRTHRCGELSAKNIGETVTVVKLEGDWANIYHDGELGYIYKKYLTNPKTEYNYNKWN